MVKIKPFKATRPPKQYAAEVASRPYDVLNSQEAKAEATERSLLHIIKPEIDFDPIAGEHEQRVYGEKEIVRMLSEAGFSDIRMFDDYTDKPVSAETQRVVFTARK